MKKTMVCLAVMVGLAVAGVVGMAAGPFIGTEITWGWPAVNFGYDSDVIKGWITKYEPLVVSGWWGAGVEGRWRIMEQWPNFKLAIGARTGILWEDWTTVDWYWGPTVAMVWDWGLYQIAVRGLLPIPVDEDAPLLGVAFSIGADINLGAVFDELVGPVHY